jgi:DNA-binding transcriptional ArsR family regulator
MAPMKTRKPLDSTLAAVLSHPIRSRCLTILTERTASPNEIATSIGEDVGNVSYHVRVLQRLEMIELVDERKVRGAIEHFYRAVTRTLLSDEEIASLSLDERLTYTRHILQMAVADQAIALEDGSYDRRSDRHLSRTRLIVDEEGWEELRQSHEELLQRTLDIQAASAERLSATAGAGGISTSAICTFFELPAPP